MMPCIVFCKLFLRLRSRRFKPCHFKLLFVMPFYNVADRQDRIAQTSVVNAAVLCVDLGRLGEDQPLLFKTANVLLHAIFASTDGFTDRRVAGMTLEGFSVLATHQKRVYQYLAVGQPETEDLIRHGKEVLHFLILQIHRFTSRRKLKRNRNISINENLTVLVKAVHQIDNRFTKDHGKEDGD